MGARVTVSFDNTKGDALTLSVSGAVLDAEGHRYNAPLIDVETMKPWNGEIAKGESKTIRLLARLAKHKLKVGHNVRMVVVVKDNTGQEVELTSDRVGIVGAM
jgi:hypothetical protein